MSARPRAAPCSGDVDPNRKLWRASRFPNARRFASNAGRLSGTQARANDHSPIPSAPFDDLDLDRPEDEEEWERRVMAMAAARIAAERVRLERLGIIDENGDLRSTVLPPDMLPDSDTSVDTG